jgi:hypothetical protein
MTPDDQTSPSADEGDGQQTEEISEEVIDSVQVDTAPLERAEEAIDEAREAASKVARTDSVDEEATGAGELPAFADDADGSSSDDAADEED